MAFSLLWVLIALVSASEQPAPKPTDLPATVIAHLPLPQAAGNQMLLQKEDEKQYLYVQQFAKQGFMLLPLPGALHRDLPPIFSPGIMRRYHWDTTLVLNQVLKRSCGAWPMRSETHPEKVVLAVRC